MTDLSAFSQKDNSGGIKMPSRLSYSAVSKYSACGEKYRLERLHHVATGTWWATVAGKAVHYITEMRDRIEIMGLQPECEVTGKTLKTIDDLPTFTQALDHFVEKESSNVEIKASGRVLKDYGWQGGPGKRDREWWIRFGPQYVEAYVKWRDERTDWDMTDVEVDFEVPLGGEPVIGYIDRVFVTEDGQLVLVDLKTGSNEPTDSIQLVTYREGFRVKTGLVADYGYYLFFRWVQPEKPVIPPRPKKPTKPQIAAAEKAAAAHDIDFSTTGVAKELAVFELWEKTKAEIEAQEVEPGYVECYLSYGTDLEAYSQEYIENIYQMARRGVEQQVFLPNTTDGCMRTCGVSEFCRAVGGARATEYPIVDTIKVRTAAQTESVGGVSSDPQPAAQ